VKQNNMFSLQLLHRRLNKSDAVVVFSLLANDIQDSVLSVDVSRIKSGTCEQPNLFKFR
jgi:hypothetical protein